MKGSLIGIGVALVAAPALIYLRSKWLALKFHHKELVNLARVETKLVPRGDGSGVKEIVVKRVLEIKARGNNIVFTKYRRDVGLLFFEAQKPVVEHAFGRKFPLISVERAKWYQLFSQPKVIFHGEKFPNELEYPKLPSKRGDFIVGLNGFGNWEVRNTRECFSVFCTGGAGSGKTGYGRVYINSLCEHLPRGQFDLIVIDAKGSPYLNEIKKFGGRVFNPLILEEARELVAVLKAYRDQINEYSKWLKEASS